MRVKWEGVVFTDYTFLFFFFQKNDILKDKYWENKDEGFGII